MQAIKILNDKYENIEVIIAGGGDLEYEKLLKKKCIKLGIEKKVRFTGKLKHQAVIKLFSESHLIVQLSKTAENGDTEGLPFVLLEGQASGLPVISTYHSGIPEGLINNKTGFLVNEGDFKGAAEKIEFFINNPKELKHFSLNAREYIEKEFDIVDKSQELVNLYKKTIIDNN